MGLHTTTFGYRGKRSPPERATGVDLGDRGERSPPERATGVDLGDRGERSLPERATGGDTSPDPVVGHRKPCLILERSPDL